MSDSFLIVDDHPLFRDALKSAIEVAFPLAAIAEAAGIGPALAILAERHDVDLLLLDLSMPGVTGFEGLLAIRSRHPRLPVVIVSGIEDRQVVDRALACGIAGFIPKSVHRTELIEAIRRVKAGAVYVPPARASEAGPPGDRATDLLQRLKTLTPQQWRVLELIRQGKPNKQIAYELHVGETTAKAHVSEILRKLNVRSRTMAISTVGGLDRPVEGDPG